MMPRVPQNAGRVIPVTTTLVRAGD